MFGKGQTTPYGGSLNFMPTLDDGRTVGVSIRPDDITANQAAYDEPSFMEYHDKEVTAELVRAYFPDAAKIEWGEKPKTRWGRSYLSGTNGKYRIELATGLKDGGDPEVSVEEMKAWLVAKVYGN